MGKLEDARIARGWTVQQVAQMIGISGYLYGNFEKLYTIHRPGTYVRKRLCKLFGMTEQELGIEPFTNKLCEYDPDGIRYVDIGITRTTYLAFRTGRKIPTDEMLHRLEEAFGVSAEELGFKYDNNARFGSDDVPKELYPGIPTMNHPTNITYTPMSQWILDGVQAIKSGTPADVVKKKYGLDDSTYLVLYKMALGGLSCGLCHVYDTRRYENGRDRHSGRDDGASERDRGDGARQTSDQQTRTTGRDGRTETDDKEAPYHDGRAIRDERQTDTGRSDESVRTGHDVAQLTQLKYRKPHRSEMTEEQLARVKESDKQYYQRHKKQRIADATAYAKAHPEVRQRWKEKHPDYYKEYWRKKKEMMQNETDA